MSPRLSAVMARERALFYAAACKRLHHEAWRQIIASKRLLRCIGISGGAASDPLTEKIRAALQVGVLPRIDDRTWAGKAAGDRVCACCALPIRAGEIEYEPQAASRQYAHLPCFFAWRQESARLEHEAGSREPGLSAAEE